MRLLRLLRRWFVPIRTARRCVEIALKVGFYAGWHAAATGRLDMDAAFAAYEAEQNAEREPRVLH
jgi:hypothetical protein